MATPSLVTNYVALSAMLTPALFMTANGSLIISTSNRMSRIVDGIRSINDALDKMDRGVTDLDYVDDRRGHYNDLIRSLEVRSDRIRFALTLLYLALSSFVATSLVIALDVILGSRLMAIPTILAVVGVGLMFAASVNLTLEAHQGLRSNRQEISFHRNLRAKRHADREEKSRHSLEMAGSETPPL